MYQVRCSFHALVKRISWLTPHFSFPSGYCDFLIAVCDPGKVPVSKNGQKWKANGHKASYKF